MLLRAVQVLRNQSREKGVRVCPELPKVGILVSRILNISERRSGHFQIVVVNLSIFGIYGYNTFDL